MQSCRDTNHALNAVMRMLSMLELAPVGMYSERLLGQPRHSLYPG